ncbi:pectin esterase [Aestuariibacter sp. GS-14]|uniref:pectinesterase family protein n=1 Tax=Aestuariibacter sp. GS-14 TaxID=2590670 RepID=UPI001129BCCE|nr:pectinesterase family protein [Aestuariibacter sp. GS-14]TPV59038.1 pectin esterase [Aestuariibacter sp. GS-14]
MLIQGRIAGLLALLLLLAGGCGSQPRTQHERIDARVFATPGDGTYTSVQAAVDAAPNAQNWTIFIGPGVFEERVIINKPGIRLVGSGKRETKIAYTRYAGEPVTPGSTSGSEETWGTFRTAVVEVLAPDVSLFDLTIENTYDYPADDKLPKGHPNKIRGTQAVALKIAEQADRTVLQRVALMGYQDTLYAESGRTYIADSEIFGHVDFIFGAGNVLFDYTDVISRPRAHPMTFTGYVTAPSTLIEQDYGFTFLNCRLLREIGVPNNSVPLGRPWHPTTTFADGRYANPNAIGKSTFINTFMDSHIAQVGWSSMGGTAKDGTRKQFMPLSDARFSEYGSYGPGAYNNADRPQLSDAELLHYTPGAVLNHWTPTTLSRAAHRQLIQ